MKDFEQLYQEITEEHGCNAGETFAKAMFEAGQELKIEEWLKEVSAKDKGFFQLMQFVLMRISEEAIRLNAGEVALSQKMRQDDCVYTTRMAVQFFKEGEATLDEKVYELVDRMLSNGTANCDLREEMKKAVLVGYNLHNEDFDN